MAFVTVGNGVSTFVVTVLTFYLLQFAFATRRSSSLPPGPPTLPILGNLHQIPLKKSYLKFQEWSKTYGAIVSLKIGPGDLIILNSARIVRDLLDKRGGIYSSRPPNHVAANIVTRDNTHLLLMPYGPEWRAQRKVYQSILSPTAVTKYQPLQEAEAILTLQQLFQSPQKYYDSIRRYSIAVILSAVFGVRGPDYNHPDVQRLYHAQDQFAAILELGATPPVDVFPILKYVPRFFAPWRTWALNIRAEQRELYTELLQRVKTRREHGIQRNSFVDQLITEQSQNGLDDEHIAYIGGVLMEGGSETTASTLLAFLMAMAKYPQVLEKAQKAVDAVCGTDRSPNFQDIKDLPYIKCIVNEVLRWRPVAAGGVPHALIQDDVYKGYHFRKGTVFLANTWALHHDPELYDCPEQFIPERFESNENGYKEGASVPDGTRVTYGFGAGRRICPGIHLADNSLLINISKIVWAFDITPGEDFVTGRRLLSHQILDSVETEWTDGLLTVPKPFPLALRVRSARHQDIVNRECTEAREVFSGYEDKS